MHLTDVHSPRAATTVSAATSILKTPAPLPGLHRPRALGKPIRLLLIDDHPVVRKGLCSCLARHEHLVVVGEAGDGQEGLRKARELRPDVVIMDIDMPVMNGLAAAEAFREELPEVKVLILSMYSNSEFVTRILQSGAKGYVLKEAVTDELMLAIEKVNAGEPFFSSDVARVALNQYVRGHNEKVEGRDITPRERQVLIAIAEGLSNKEIASRLNVGVRTIETHRERIMRKLNIHSIAGLTRYAIARGYVALQKEGCLSRPA
jgi:two-component system, NarL family, nitrate/nitrite response regulator NarL